MTQLLLLILALFLLTLGIIGCLFPIIPGPPLSFGGLLLFHFTKYGEFSLPTLLIFGFFTILITLLDYIVPVWGTKKMGGTKWGIRGSTIGLIIGVIVLPLLGLTLGPGGLFSLILSPFLGAYIGEYLYTKNARLSLKAAFGSFLGFFTGVIMKLSLSFLFLFLVIIQIVQYILQ